MKAAVVETNVLAVANDKAAQAGPPCVLACVNALEDIKHHRITLLDSGMKIFDEYRRHASFAGQPGLGDSFFKWLWSNQANPKHCRLVDITPTADDPNSFEEFPNDPALEGFDRSDRKFVAVALTGQRSAKVFNAADTDWWHYRDELRTHGLVRLLQKSQPVRLPRRFAPRNDSKDAICHCERSAAILFFRTFARASSD